MKLSKLRKYLSDGMMEILPENPKEGFENFYTLLPTGEIKCENSVLSKIKNQSFEEGNKSGFLEIKFTKSNNIINSHIHSIFYSKNISEKPTLDYKDRGLSVLGLSEKMTSKEHILFFFEQFTLQTELDCEVFLKEMEKSKKIMALDIPNKTMYLQVGISIIHNSKELIIAFHDTYKNKLINTYKAIL